MPVFRVYLNGRKLSTAGIGDLGVLSAIVSWVRRKVDRTRSRKANSVEEELSVSVSGLITQTQEHVRWLNRPLKVGDQVCIQIVENASIDQPRRRVRRDAKEE